MTEVELVGAVKCGDNQAFVALVTVHKGMLYNLASRWSKKLSIEDLLQSARLSLWRAALKYDAAKGASFATYAARRIRADLRRCVTLWAADVSLSDEERQRGLVYRAVHYDGFPSSDGVIGADHFAGSSSVEAEVVHHDLKNEVAGHVDALPRALRTLVVHRWWGEATLEEAGAAAGYSKQWAKVLQNRAFKRLRAVRALAELAREAA